MLERFLALLVILGLCVLALPASAEDRARDGVRMVCLNVGKGDAVLISLQSRHYLIDTGYKRTWKSLKAMLEKEGVRRLEGVFITHPHKDHMGGLDKLLRSGVQIGAVYAPMLSQLGTGRAHPVAASAADAGLHVRFLESGDLVSVSASAFFEVLGPITLNTDNENNNSLVMRLVSPDGSILLTGDMKAEEEFSLLRAGVLSPCDVLKVPFHGDESACTAAFLKAVRPAVSVISTSSREEKDTPAKETLQRLKAAGSKVFVTQSAPFAVVVTLKNKKITVLMTE